MKYVLMVILGLLVGAAMGLAILYFNPLTSAEDSAPGPGDLQFSYSSPISGGLAFTHGGLSHQPTHPALIPELWENTIDQTLLSVFAVTSADGQVGIASRVSLPSELTAPLTRGVIVTDHWLITIPNEGSLFVDSDINLWPFFKQDLLPVRYLGRDWGGPRDYQPTAGPGIDGAALVQGATGRFANTSGSAVGHYRTLAFNARQGAEQFEAELILTLSAAQAEAQLSEPAE